MPAQAYELVALGARYWFAFLGVVIVWRSFTWLRKDRKARLRRLRQLPDAGLVGELVVLAGSDALPPGTSIPLPREGALGSLRSCDVYIPCSGVAGRHGDFRFMDGVGLVLTPVGHQSFQVDHQEPLPGQREWVMHHGSRLALGDALLRLRLFMGLTTAQTAAFQEDAPVYGSMPQPAILKGEEPVQAWNPDWDTDTIPHRQQFLSWQDTARYGRTEEYADLLPGEEPEEWPGMEPQEESPEETEYPEPWEEPAPSPAPRRRLFGRRR